MSNCVLKFRTVLLIIGAFVYTDIARAQLADEFNPPRANCCLATSAKGLADQLQDWNQLGRYHPPTKN